ncbi:glycoside hydrolase [Punctularia strigosozonata HHB-11173 SS5]|uniref:glycoside hydrolase n=1 Tax=Punctularia strigosozonata (strain HHB-11173) TaxID=741275 RepID=UPI0004416545|nr:glycoside hydrolase [Punctularia strigosozonata HHB-11173 SS5]EIN07794.1 glycoside hydrolase [Punctularia strigosozonata HHB-11173 SS5]
MVTLRPLGLLLVSGIAYATAQDASLLSNGSEAMLWGPYRPNLYFGIRPRLPQSLMTGLVWFGVHDYMSVSQARHSCEQGDQLDGYTWTEYDSRRGGVQVIKDGKNNVKITTEYLKVPGGEHGGSWAARIKGEPLNEGRPSMISTIFYAGIEGFGGLDMETDESENDYESDLVFAGSSTELDEFTLRVVDNDSNNHITNGPHSASFANRAGKTHVSGYRIPSGDVWTAKDYIMQDIITHAQPILDRYKSSAQTTGYPAPAFLLQLSDEVLTSSNVYAVQKTFEGPFEFDVFFESKSAGSQGKLSGATLDAGIASLTASVEAHFEATFPIDPATLPADADIDGLKTFSKEITANLLGGVGYFYGTSIVDKGFAYEWDEDDEPELTISDDDDEDENSGRRKEKKGGARLTEPRALLTATPSRSFFPRGFYWDEGFHLLHIGPYDTDFSLEILKDWIGLIDENGWVAREQILGEEARSKVPAEFQTQVPTYANPPTLTMAVTAFIERLKAAGAAGPSDAELGMDFGGPAAQTPLRASAAELASSRYLAQPELALDFLRGIYAPLKRHYEWFRRTQRGQIKQYARKARSRTESYRWRGRSASHVLTSGMDDYPRGPPHAGELHLDLISWMAFFSGTMHDIAAFVGETDDAASYAEIRQAIVDNIDDLHWNEEEQMYCDAGVNDDDESYHVCHRGYLSLFPLLLEILDPASPHLGALLDLLRDPEHLWSPYGLRSLSASHPEFGQGENYWKGPIWIQMNYLALRALHKTYAAHEGPHQARAKEIYQELRLNVINNEYKRTGYVWEQYDALTGEGRRSHPFTGWTSLLTLSKSYAARHVPRASDECSTQFLPKSIRSRLFYSRLLLYIRYPRGVYAHRWFLCT